MSPSPWLCKQADVHSVKTNNVTTEVLTCPLIAFNGTFNGVPVRILNDDSFNTNVISTEFVRKLKGRCTLKSAAVTVKHVRDGSSENSSQFIMPGKLRIGPCLYVSYLVVMECRYDNMLGIPRYVSIGPCVDYVNAWVRVLDNNLPRKSKDYISEDAV